MSRTKPSRPLTALIADRLRIHCAQSVRELARSLSRTRAETSTAIQAMADDIEPDPADPRRWRLR
jgi:hypothetical protein